MDQQQLEEIKKRNTARTPGIWGYKEGTFKHYVFSRDEKEDFGISLQEFHWFDGHEVPAKANAQFIAHASEDIPALLAEVERLQAENEQLKFNLTMAQHYDAPEWLRRKTR